MQRVPADDFVPPEARAEEVPCHHIPLNATGATIDVLELKGDQPETEQTVKSWLRATIIKIEGADNNRLNS